MKSAPVVVNKNRKHKTLIKPKQARLLRHSINNVCICQII